MTANQKSTVLKTALGGLALAVLATVAAQPATAQAGTRPDWGTCPGGGGPRAMECARVTVPVDWDEAGGREISLLIGRLPAENKPKGTVVVNYGGPGGPAVGAMRDKPEVYDELREDMNVVTWDYRGYTSLDGDPLCKQTRLPVPPIPADQAEFDALAETNHALGRQCRDNDPELFDNMGSAAHARDLEAVRKALGERRLNLIATSYGGSFAQTYARDYPHRIRTLLLDGAWDHGEAPAEHARNQARDNERKLQRFFEWTRDTDPRAGADIEQRWRDLVARADEEPIPAPDVDAEFTGFQLRQTAIGMAVAKKWEPLPAAIRDAEAGDASGFAAHPDHPYPNYGSPGMTECQDFARPSTHQELAATIDELNAIAPNAGAAVPDVIAALVCVGWPAPVTSTPAPLPTGELPPILAAGTWLEYDSLARATARIPGSTTISYDGPGHALYLAMADPCVIEHADTYLVDRVVPEPGTTCPAE